MVEENKKEETKEEKQGEKVEEAKSASPEAVEDKKATESKEEKTKEVKEEPKKEQKEEKKEKPEEKEEVEVPEKFKEIVEKIEKMSVMDLAELVKILEKKFGVTAASQVAAVPISDGTADDESPAEEKTEFNIELKEVGSQKIQVIKAVRDVTEKGLKESKDLVDAAADSPQIVRENVKKEEAEEIRKKFEEAGAKVELK